jgi:chromate transporter
MNGYFELFITFAKIGFMTFGGGYAMLPMLQREVCETKQWAENTEIMDYYAIGQCTPGIIAINVATFIGKKYKGNLGGIVATFGMVFPSLMIISFIAAIVQNFSQIVWVQNAFAGVRICVSVFIVSAVLKLFKHAVIDWITALIFSAVLAGSLFLSLSPVVFVLAAGIVGILITGMGVRK